MDAILCDVLSYGNADTELQLSVLGNQNQDVMFQEVQQLVEAKASVRRLLESWH